MTDTKRWVSEIRHVQPPELWQEVERRARDGEPIREPSGRRRPLLVAVLLLGALAVVGSVLYALRSLGNRSEAVSPAPGEIVRYRVDGAPQPLAVGEGAVWVDVTAMSPRGTGPSTIWRIDARTGEAKSLPETIGAVWITAGEEGVWATCNAGACGGSGVLQLDPATGDVIRTISLPGRTDQIAEGLGSVWVSTDGGVVRIDAESGSILSTFPGSYNFLGIGGGALWATTTGGVVQMDPSSGERLNHIPFPDPCYLDVTTNTVFVATCGGATVIHDALQAIDARTGQILYRVLRDSWGSMRLAGRTLIIAESDPMNPDFVRLVRLDAATGKRVRSPFEVGSNESRFFVKVSFGPYPFLAVGEGSAWFTDFGAGEVIRVGLPLRGDGMPTPSPTPVSPATTFGS
jgi:hypothetical protein